MVNAERRTASRYATPGTPVLIAWGEGPDYRTTAGTLTDISLGGCAVQVTTLLPKQGAVSIRLAGPAPSPWIQASVLQAVKRWRFAWTRRIVRLRFTESCPYDLFKAAIAGFTREIQLPDFEAQGYSIRDWR